MPKAKRPSRAKHLKAVPAPAGLIILSNPRPRPPFPMIVPDARDQFVPALDLEIWVRETFIAEGAKLANAEHAHLRDTRVACLWTNVENARHGQSVVGTCEMLPPPAMGKWARGRALQQMEGWFLGHAGKTRDDPLGQRQHDEMPTFVLTFFAPYALQVDDASWCALCEHELLHAGQAKDEYGAPKFSKSTGKPIFAMRGHDCEEFASVVRRYGAGASTAATLIDAAKRPPEITAAAISGACGACLRAAA